MKVGLEKLENHEGVAVKALLDSGATGLFMDTTFAREKGFKMERMKYSLLVKNVDGTVNIGGAITHQVECNMFFKGHVERVRMDVCNLGKTEVILGMPWLAAHNPEIDWEKREVKMTRCPPICGKKKQECNDRPHFIQVFTMMQPHGPLFCFTSLHISNGSVSASLVGHVLYSADLMSATCIPHSLLMVHRYIYSRYSPVFLMLYQLYYSLPSSTLISSSSLYLKLQPELLLKVVTKRREKRK